MPLIMLLQACHIPLYVDCLVLCMFKICLKFYFEMFFFFFINNFFFIDIVCIICIYINALTFMQYIYVYVFALICTHVHMYVCAYIH